MRAIHFKVVMASREKRVLFIFACICLGGCEEISSMKFPKCSLTLHSIYIYIYIYVYVKAG